MVKSSTSRFFETINQGDYSFVENPVPVFYVLFAYYNRMRLLIRKTDVTDFDIIPEHIDRSFYHELKQHAEPAMIKYEETFSDLIAYMEMYAGIDYEGIVESLVSELSRSNGKFSNCSFSKEFMEVIATLIFRANGDIRQIIEAYGGCGSAQMMQVDHSRESFDWITSYNPDAECRLIAGVRTYIHRLFECDIYHRDPLTVLNDLECSLLLYNSPNTWSAETINDLIHIFLHHSDCDTAAVLHLPAKFCYAPEYNDARCAIVEANVLSTVILLPNNVCDNLKESSVLVCLEKLPQIDEILFIDARQYVSDNGEFRGFELSDDIWKAKSPSSLKPKFPECFISKKVNAPESGVEIHLIHPLLFITENLNKSSEDYVEVKPSSLFSFSHGMSDFSCKSGFVITDNCFADTQDKLFESLSPKEQNIPEGYVKHVGKSLVISTRYQRFELAVIVSDIEFYTSREDIVLSFNGPLGAGADIMYFAHYFMARPGLHALILWFDSYNSLEGFFKLVKLPVLYDEDDRHEYVEALRRTYLQKQNTEDEIQKATSDLRHILGVTFGTISDRIKYLKDAGLPESAITDLIKIEHNVNYIGRAIDSFSNDFLVSNKKSQKMHAFISEYVSSWESLGREGFKLEFISNLSDDICADLDKDQIYIMLDTILENARRHGFGKVKREGNLVQMILDYTEYDGKDYIAIKIQNNGHRLPDDFTIDCYIRKGAFAGKYGRSGIGGYHVARITQQHKGYLSVYSDDSWGAIVEVLIPVKLN
jgi:signal transduction histidine kinase